MQRKTVVIAWLMVTACLVSAVGAAGPAWIWSDNSDPAPKNRFTYFRQVVALDAVPADATLRFAADSIARLWINGQIVRRKVARYHEPLITAEVVDAGPYLRKGRNVVVVLHHNWGDIITFQRTANEHAGLWISGDWINSDATWRCKTAPQFVPHDKQMVGIIGDPRIRYPLIVDGRKTIEGDLHDPAFDDSSWPHAQIVSDGPWPTPPTDVETPGQREHAVTPGGIVAAGVARHEGSVSHETIPADPFAMAIAIKAADCQPDADMTQAAGALVTGGALTIRGHAGETKYVTMDFQRPVHGYPYLSLKSSLAGATIDWGYCEIARSQYTGEMHVRESGWINPAGVVSVGYGDRYVTREGEQSIELPDERTVRWLALHVHFPAEGEITLHRAGVVKSQYPIRPVGTFACGDKRIEQIIELCLTHAEVTMTDTYIDTPGREDGQWIEDDRPRAMLAARWFGDEQARKLMIRTLAQGQFPDGNLHPFAPSNYPVGGAGYDWSVQWVAMLYDQYMWSGDIEEVRPWFETLQKYWANALAHVRDDGLWVTGHVLADLRVGVHPKGGESSGIVTPWMIERLRWSAELADALGESKQAADWREAAGRMTEAFNKYHVVPAGDGVPAHVADVFDPAGKREDRGYSQAGQTVAIMSGLMSGDAARANIEYAFGEPGGSPPAGVTRWNNPTYGYRSLRAMSDVGMFEQAVAHLIERYEPYLPNNPRNRVPVALQGPYGGPLPEYWVSREDLGLAAGEKNTAQPADETGSHGWGSVPLLWLHDSLLGVRITEPGGGKLTVAPRTGGLPYVAGHTVTPKGVVWVYCDPQQWLVEVEIPEDITATVVLPPEMAVRRVVVVPGEKLARAFKGGVYVVDAPGRYVFRAQ